MQHFVIHRDCRWSESHVSHTGFKSHDMNYSLQFGLGPKCCPLLMLSVTLCSHFWFCFVLQSLDKLFSGCCIVSGMWKDGEKKKKRDVVSDFWVKSCFPYVLLFPVACFYSKRCSFFPNLWAILILSFAENCQLLLQADRFVLRLEKSNSNLPKEIIHDILPLKYSSYMQQKKCTSMVTGIPS